jgi:hypothetical protein
MKRSFLLIKSAFRNYFALFPVFALPVSLADFALLLPDFSPAALRGRLGLIGSVIESITSERTFEAFWAISPTPATISCVSSPAADGRSCGFSRLSHLFQR